MDENKWSTYESNMQAYRSCFLSSQSIMLAVGAVLLDKSKIAIIIIAVLSMFQILFVWVPVIYKRSLIVDFHKYNMAKKFDKKGNKIRKNNKHHLTEIIYCNNRKVRKKVNSKMSKNICNGKTFVNIRKTRMKIDIIIPISMISLWAIYICISFGIIE